jgi:hypothetical protein
MLTNGFRNDTPPLFGGAHFAPSPDERLDRTRRSPDGASPFSLDLLAEKIPIAEMEPFLIFANIAFPSLWVKS